MARRRADIWDDFFEALRWLFTVVHPAWSILVAAVFFLIPVIWFQHSIKIPQAQLLGVALGAVPAIVSLAAGAAGWKLRQQRAAFLQQHLDIDWLNKLSWQDFERQVAEVYRQRSYQVDEVGGGGRSAAWTSGSGATARPPSSSASGGRRTRWVSNRSGSFSES